MKTFLAILFLVTVVICSGCTQTTATSSGNTEEVSINEYADEEVVVESDDGYDAEAERLLRGNGYFMNVVESYTMPATDADAAASPDTVLKDTNGEPYKIVKHIGLDD